MPSSWTPSTCRRRTMAPVAMSAWPKRTVSFDCNVAVRAAGSSAMTLVRVLSSTPCSSHQPSGWTSAALGLRAALVAARAELVADEVAGLAGDDRELEHGCPSGGGGQWGAGP